MAVIREMLVQSAYGSLMSFRPFLQKKELQYVRSFSVLEIKAIKLSSFMTHNGKQEKIKFFWKSFSQFSWNSRHFFNFSERDYSSAFDEDKEGATVKFLR